MVSSLAVVTTRRGHVISATSHHLVPTPIALPVQVRVAAPLHQHRTAAVPLRVHPFVPPVEVVEAVPLVGVAAPALARREIVEPGRTLGDVRRPRLLVAVLSRLVTASVQTPGGGLLRAADRRLGRRGRSLVHLRRFFTDPSEVVVAPGRAVPQAAGLFGGGGRNVGGGAIVGPVRCHLQSGVIFGTRVFLLQAWTGHAYSTGASLMSPTSLFCLFVFLPRI
jgi:hypothetical protein